MKKKLGFFQPISPKPSQNKQYVRPVSPIKLSPFGRKAYASPKSNIQDQTKRFSRTPNKSQRTKRIVTQACDLTEENGSNQKPNSILKNGRGLFQQISYISKNQISKLEQDRSKSKIKNRRPIFEEMHKTDKNNNPNTEKMKIKQKENKVPSFLAEKFVTNKKQKTGSILQKDDKRQYFSDIKLEQNINNNFGVINKISKKQNEQSFSDIIQLIKKAKNIPNTGINEQKQNFSQIKMIKSPKKQAIIREENKKMSKKPEQSFSDVEFLIKAVKKNDKQLEMNKKDEQWDNIRVDESLTMSPYLD